MDFTGTQGIILACLAAGLIFTLMILVYRLLRKNPPVGKLRFGFFIEHDYDRVLDTQVYNYEDTREFPAGDTIEDTRAKWPIPPAEE